MFDSERNVLVFSIFMAFLIIGSIVEGYIIHDQIIMTPDNWQGIIIFRFFLHLIGIAPVLYLMGMLWESVWKAIVLGMVLLAVMNYYPIMDLVKGPIIIDQPQPEKWVREEYNHPSSDVDFSTHEVPMIRLEQGGRSIMMTEDRWERVLGNCEGQIPAQFVGLEYLEVELEWKCDL